MLMFLAVGEPSFCVGLVGFEFNVGEGSTSEEFSFCVVLWYEFYGVVRGVCQFVGGHDREMFLCEGEEFLWVDFVGQEVSNDGVRGFSTSYTIWR